jgi:hypothetical protein
MNSTALKICFLLLFVAFAALCSPLLAQEKFPKHVLLEPKRFSEQMDAAFYAVEYPEYHPSNKNAIVLQNGYASAVIRNAEDYPLNITKQIDTVEVIFSLYPKKADFWLTDYHILLARRLQKLFEIDSLLNHKDIHFKLVLQSDCENELEAMGLFHGFRIVFTPKAALTALPPSKEEEMRSDSLLHAPAVVEVKQFISDNGGFGDSAVFKILERNSQWKNAVVVLDWTGSMYHHGAMAVLWNILHFEKAQYAQFVFFNDGNNKANRKKKIGKTGGILMVNAMETQKLITSFSRVQKRGSGGDSQENDVEALLKAMRKFPEAEHFILVADNVSCMRDFVLVEKLKKPVHIVLAGNYQLINHQYINLAYKTQGSLHTFEHDIWDFSHNPPNSFNYNDVAYFLNNYNLYQCENELSYRFCNAFYGIPKYTKRIKDAGRSER